MRQSARLAEERGEVHKARRCACLALQSGQIELVAGTSIAHSAGSEIGASEAVGHSAGVAEIVSAVQKVGGRIVANQTSSQR